MSFSEKQVRLLQRHIHPRHLRSREANGREFTYIEGWHAIDEANRIFGFDGWDRETVESRCISARETHGVFRALYMARTRITVRADGVSVVREGSGTGDARGASFAEAHDFALKSAETDATKRALATFGKPFGLALYLKSRKKEVKDEDNVSHRTRYPLHVNDPARANHPNAARYGGRGSAPARPPKEALAIRDLAKTRDRPKQPFISSLAPKEVPASAQASTNRETKAASPQAPSVNTASQPLSAQGNLPAAPTPTDTDPVRDDARSRIDKSVLTHGAARRYRDKAHLRFVAEKPCLICSRQPSDAHHLRHAQPRSLSQKVSDEFTVPLCRLHHRELHQAGKEQAWWEAHSIDPLPIAQELWTESRARRFDPKDRDLVSSDQSQSHGSQ